MIQLDDQVCRDFAAAVQREWLETNGIGGYASSTIVGANTRRYHGLLVAATHPPVGRYVLLSKIEETVCVAEDQYELSCNQYPGAVHPQGYKFLQTFALSPFPTWEYAVKDIVLQKSLCMIQGQNTTVVTYTLKAGSTIRLLLRPLIAGRDYHSLHYENTAIQRQVEFIDEKAIRIVPYEPASTLYLRFSAGSFTSDAGHWYRDFEYPMEAERGFDAHEDLYSPGYLTTELNPGDTVALIAATQLPDAGWEPMEAAESDRRQRVLRFSKIDAIQPEKDDFAEALLHAADPFIVQRNEGLYSIIAGYPWFTDWGRDAMIALPGLTLVTGRYDIAKGILRAFAQHCDQGMLPNRFPDASDTPDYNTVDATLWFFHAVAKYLEYTDDVAFIRDELWEVLVDIIRWHIEGTRYNIKMDTDGLITAGTPGVQLTWMDAKIGEWVVTPRHGKPVEINALWYNALKVMETLIQRFGAVEASTAYAQLAGRARTHFNQRFWNEETKCLYDCIDGEARDASIRPNQILAISLPHSILAEERHRSVLDVVKRELLTPFGLRSLSPADGRYVGHYIGDPYHRDSAYHQGTVWGWLIGPFVTAYVKVNGKTPPVQAEAKQFLALFEEHLKVAGVGSISEIFDGDAPHTPRGCIAQAWSVAEVLRAYVEDVIHPGS